jgi:hypothetical protein
MVESGAKTLGDRAWETSFGRTKPGSISRRRGADAEHGFARRSVSNLQSISFHVPIKDAVSESACTG